MSRPPKLSTIRQEIFNFIVAHKAAHDGNSPSIRQIAEKFRRSTNTVSYDLSYMEAVGLIERDKVESRGIKVIGGMWVAPSTPLSATPTSPHLEEHKMGGVSQK